MSCMVTTSIYNAAYEDLTIADLKYIVKDGVLNSRVYGNWISTSDYGSVTPIQELDIPVQSGGYINIGPNVYGAGKCLRTSKYLDGSLVSAVKSGFSNLIIEYSLNTGSNINAVLAYMQYPYPYGSVADYANAGIVYYENPKSLTSKKTVTKSITNMQAVNFGPASYTYASDGHIIQLYNMYFV